MFLDVCIEEINANNRPVQVLTKHGYASLIKKFNERTKRNYNKVQMKNRWETLKKDYTVWKGLLQHASGLGIDPITHTIAASDDWWENEIQVMMIYSYVLQLLFLSCGLMIFCDMQMCPEAAKFRIAPLQDEEDLKILFDKNVVTNVNARVPPTSQIPSSGVPLNIDEDVDGSGCEGEDDLLVTPVRPSAKKKARNCPYSPSPSATPKMSSSSSNAIRLDRMMEMMEKREKNKEMAIMMEEEKRMREEEKSKNSVTSPAREEKSTESSRDEIRRLVALIYEDGAKPGSMEYFYATQLFLLQHYREMFACLVEDATPAQRLDWIRMTWEQYNKK